MTAYLFSVDAKPAPRGRVRAGLELDIRAARAGGRPISAGGVAALRTLADQLDALGRWLAGNPRAAPRDRVSLATLVRQFDATYARVFADASTSTDPLEVAFADFRATQAALTEHADTATVRHPAFVDVPLPGVE